MAQSKQTLMTTDQSKVEQGNRLIAEGNELIMKFDGWKLESRQTFDPDHNAQNPGSNTYYVYAKNGRIVRPEDIEFDIVYHQSWDALMPVCYKFDNLFGSEISDEVSKQWQHWCDAIDGAVILYEIDSLFPIVVQAIEWYNSTQQGNKIK